MPLYEERIELEQNVLKAEQHQEFETFLALQKQGIVALENQGLLLRGLQAESEQPGVLDRFLVTYTRPPVDESHPLRLWAGDPVLLYPGHQFDIAPVYAVIERVQKHQLTLVFDKESIEQHDWLSVSVGLCLLAPQDVSYKRMNQALSLLLQAKGTTRHLAELLLCGKTITQKPVPPLKEPLACGLPLNNVQQQAVAAMLMAPSVYALHGPPGTGKTTVLAAFVSQTVAQGGRVLVSAPTHEAVDQLCRQLLSVGVNCVRLGHPVRIHDDLWPHTLESKLKKEPHIQVIVNLLEEASALFRLAVHKKRQGRALDAQAQASELFRQAKALRAEARALEKEILKNLLHKSPVLCTTLTGIKHDFFSAYDLSFDVGVVDEAAQAITPAIAMVLPYVSRLVLAGDHCQLGAVLLSCMAQEHWRASLFESCVQSARVPHLMLQTQYRMHADIMAFPSSQLYQNRLLADEQVKARGLEGSPWPAVVFVDTAGCGFEEIRAPKDTSLSNPFELDVLMRVLEQLPEHYLNKEQVGLISPYQAQVQLMQSRFGARYEVQSIDGFQGREKDIIVVSLVRSNDTCDIGFLSDVKRMNVAMTRAKRALIVIGDSSTIGHHPFYRDFLEYASKQGEHLTAWALT